MKVIRNKRLVEQVKRFRARFAQSAGGCLAQTIPAASLLEWVKQSCGHWRERLYGSLQTLKLFLDQVLSADQNCQDAVCRALSEQVTDDKSLPKAERKRLQIKHAAHASSKAKLVKLADKICNLRDILSLPPADWPAERKHAYFDWAADVVSGVRGIHPGLEAVFDGLVARHAELD